MGVEGSVFGVEKWVGSVGFSDASNTGVGTLFAGASHRKEAVCVCVSVCVFVFMFCMCVSALLPKRNAATGCYEEFTTCK